jgi:predicted NAD/FAD-binding protein
MAAYPLGTFVRFCRNHGLLQVTDRPQWLTVRGGGQTYVNRLLQDLPDVRLAQPVMAIERSAHGVTLRTPKGDERFDAVIMACHSDQSLRILGEAASEAERATLGAVQYQPNVAWLHTDTTLLPERRHLWAAWNYMAGDGAPGDQPVSVSYLLNRLQPLPFDTPLMVTLNPPRPPADAHVLQRIEYAHPVFDQGAIDAQARIAALQGERRTWFAGAWCGFGFHEDGLRSALAVATRFGVMAPWHAPAPTAVAA